MKICASLITFLYVGRLTTLSFVSHSQIGWVGPIAKPSGSSTTKTTTTSTIKTNSLFRLDTSKTLWSSKFPSRLKVAGESSLLPPPGDKDKKEEKDDDVTPLLPPSSTSTTTSTSPGVNGKITSNGQSSPPIRQRQGYANGRPGPATRPSFPQREYAPRRRPGQGGGYNRNRQQQSPSTRRYPENNPIFQLKNPLRIRRTIVQQSPPPQQRSQRPQRQQQQQRRRSSDDKEQDSNKSDSDDDDDDDDVAVPIAEPMTGTTPSKRQRKEKKRPGPAEQRKRGNIRHLPVGKRARASEMASRRSSFKKRDRRSKKARKEEAAIIRNTVTLPEGPVQLMALAELIGEKPVAVIKFLMSEVGVMATMTQSLDPSTCRAVVKGFGKIIQGEEDDDDDDEEDDEEEDENDEEQEAEEKSALDTGFAMEEEEDETLLLPRPPVVTIMGHVDHGKTSLLDTIRNTKVTAGEAGGITQHIAAYQARHNDKPITFIDTPGHAAFTDMRERGANITDIVVLVVAADDSVKQQTADSIVCARQAGVPIVVAINKCDLETADPTRVLSDLTSYDVLAEDFGGEVLSAQISAKQGTGIDDLLDKVMMQAELQDLRANPNRNAKGAVVEARVEKGLGATATTLVQSGTIKIGDFFVAGSSHGKVRALFKTDGKTRVKEAGPSEPIQIVGFEEVPSAGDLIVVTDSEQSARELAASRQRISRELDSQRYHFDLLGTVSAAVGGMTQKEHREMVVVVKADVQGSAEALTRALRELRLENDVAIVTIKVLAAETGEVTKSDVALASVTPDTSVIAFGVPATYEAMEEARTLGIDIEYYNIIYDAIESVECRMQEVLSPTPEGDYVGSARVQEVFNIGGTGKIAGSKCFDGFIRKGSNVRVLRGDRILGESTVKTLRNFKAEADRIEEGNDCGIGLHDFEDFEADDVIECFVPSSK